MKKFTDAQKLAWDIRHPPYFEEGYLLVYLGSSESPTGRAETSIARGERPEDCIEAALRGELVGIN